MTESLSFMLIGMVNGWILRGIVVGWITRHAVTRSTRDAMDRDIDAAVSRWFRRKPREDREPAKGLIYHGDPPAADLKAPRR